ncbi:glycoside hydrolase family 81 protein [Auricularia subglabra TFB-10046 SS5]|nr:glycoside hydrolase family 81 protein [Auricularia subglabra TFB-10046 SS5]
MARIAHSFLLTLTAILTSAPARAVLGPISTVQPILAGGNVANVAPPGPFFQGHKPPFPTNSWWTGFAAQPQNALVAGPVPYASLCTNDSFHFGLSEKRSFDGTSVHQPAQLDLGVSFVEHENGLDTHRAAGWDTQSVSIDFFTPGKDAAMRVFLVPGSPYMTFRFNGATPRIDSLAGAITAVDQTSVTAGGPGLTVTGTRFKITNDAGTYLLYSLDGPLTLSVDSPAMIITASAPFSGVLRLAKLDAAPHEATLDTYVANYATGVTTDYAFAGNGTTASLTFTWDVVGDENKLLMLTYPHHRRAMVAPNFLPTSALAHMTLKGWMYPALSASWTMQYKLSSIDFNAPRAPDQSCMASLIKGLEYEINHLGDPELPGDFYNWGNHLAAVARLGLIAEEVQRPDLVELVLTHLKGTWSPWLNSAYTNVQAAYETNWGGVVNKAGAGSVFVDFDNRYYNDHNLQYGYFLNIGAVIAKFDPEWLNQKNGVSTNGELLSFVARDVANPSTEDPFFPVVRHRDWFAGHSWASGVANGAGSRDQESSTEGVNAYYGTLLYAIVTGQKDLEQFARLLVATEQIGSQTYWHLYPDADPNDRDEPYPEAEARALITMGNVEDEQAGAWLFWGAERVEIAAIQILPVTPINEELYDARWVQNLLNYTAGELADPAAGDAWKSVIYLAYSNFDPHKAASLSTTLSSWGSGNSFSNQVYFIATRPNPSGAPICTGVQLNPEASAGSIRRPCVRCIAVPALLYAWWWLFPELRHGLVRYR